MPEVRFSGFVHYLGEVVGWQLGKWDLVGNIFWCEHNIMFGKGLGGRIILEKIGSGEILLSRGCLRRLGTRLAVKGRGARFRFCHDVSTNVVYRCYAVRFLAGNFGYPFGVRSVLGFRSQLIPLTKSDLVFERPRGLIAGPLEPWLAFLWVPFGCPCAISLETEHDV